VVRTAWFYFGYFYQAMFYKQRPAKMMITRGREPYLALSPVMGFFQTGNCGVSKWFDCLVDGYYMFQWTRHTEHE